MFVLYGFETTFYNTSIIRFPAQNVKVWRKIHTEKSLPYFRQAVNMHSAFKQLSQQTQNSL